MLVKLQGRWEAMRIAHVLTRFANEFGDTYYAWALDCAERIVHQVNSATQRVAVKKGDE